MSCGGPRTGGTVDPTEHHEARILVVDDEEPNVLLLEEMLAEAGYRNVTSTTDPREASSLIARTTPDLILLDLHMPFVDGFEILRALRRGGDRPAPVPVLVLTADISTVAKHRALEAGATDYLSKPFDLREVMLRIRNMLHIRFLDQALRRERDLLEVRVSTRTRDLEEAHLETFERLALAAEYRDDDTGQHTKRVGSMAAVIARTLGLPDDDVRMIGRAAALHDIGKIGITDTILLAPRKLTAEEFEVVKTHTEIGARILSGSRSPLLAMAEEIAWSHHERWDGGGYTGVEGESIPLVGRITTVADVFDALTNERPYKHAWPVDEALDEMTRQRERQFDPLVLDAFLDAQESLESASPFAAMAFEPDASAATG